jgi:protein-tyrosine kinase
MTRLLKVAGLDPPLEDSTDSFYETRPPGAGHELRIGSILVELGKLKSSQVDLVLAQQHGNPRRFGDLAMALGILAQADLELALLRQQAFAVEPTHRGQPSQDILALLSDASPQAEVLRAVRSQLVLRWFGADPEQRTLAIVSAQRRDGRTRVCSGLAVLLSQLDEDTLVIDADLRNPRMHEVFGLRNDVGLTTALAADSSVPSIQRVGRLDNLYVLTAGPSVPNPRELLLKRQFGLLMEALASRFAFIVIDTPAAGEGSESLTTAVRSSGCLVVARKNSSRMADVQQLASKLTDHSVEVLGAVINNY